MGRIKRYDWLAGVVVAVLACVNVHILNRLPYWFMYALAWCKAVLGGVSFEAVKEMWIVPLWIRAVAYYLVPAVMIAVLTFLESWIILAKVNGYRIVGCVLILIYMVTSWIVMFPLRNSADLLITRNYIFLPVLCVYIFTGIMYSVFAGTKQAGSECRPEKRKKKKKHGKRKKK